MPNTAKDNLQRYINVNGIKTIDDIKKHKGYHLYEGLLKKYKEENPNGDISDFFPSTTPTGGESESETVINYDADGAIAAAYQAQLDSLKRTKEYTEELVAAAREEAIRNAYAQYDKGKATYGRNAEQLAQMGLSNSGYGDYVEGKAYGAMVGGITNANDSADKAIRDAYYNYEQGKSKATADYNASLEAAKKAYNDKYIGLLTAVEKGEIDAETANKIAKAYNLDETHISEIATIADNYGTEKKEKAILYLNDAVKNGIADKDGNITYPTEEWIKNYGAENGLSEEEITPYINQNKENIDKVTVENYKQQITADTTDDIIDSLNFVGEDGESYKKQLKEERDKLIISETIGEIKTNGATTETIESADDLISEGKTNEGQNIYFENDLMLIQSIGDDLTTEEVKAILEKHNRPSANGKKRLSDVDYKNLLAYLESKTSSGVVDADKTRDRWLDNVIKDASALYAYSLSSSADPYIASTSQDTGVAVRIDGRRYKVSTYENAVGVEKAKELDEIAGKSGNVVKKGKNLYVKSNGEWRKVKTDSASTEPEFLDKINEKISQNSFISAPKYNQENYTP